MTFLEIIKKHHLVFGTFYPTGDETLPNLCCNERGYTFYYGNGCFTFCGTSDASNDDYKSMGIYNVVKDVALTENMMEHFIEQVITSAGGQRAFVTLNAVGCAQALQSDIRAVRYLYEIKSLTEFKQLSNERMKEWLCSLSHSGIIDAYADDEICPI